MPVDSKFFDKINDAQLAWYQMQLALDEKDQFELLRDVAEHNAMFWNPEGVKQIRESREHTFKTSSDDFNEILKGTFGRNANFDAKEAFTDKDVKKMQSGMEAFVNMELDEIKFTPYDNNED